MIVGIYCIRYRGIQRNEKRWFTRYL